MRKEGFFMEKNNFKNKPIVILGGMGPQTSSLMFKMLIDLAVAKFQAVKGDAFPHILMESIPVPEFFANKKNKKLALEILKKVVSELNKFDILCLSIACNTAHLLLPELKNASIHPFISMIDESVREIRNRRIKTLGILASPTTIKSKLYQNKLNKAKIKILIPSKKELQEISLIIGNVISGKTNGVSKKSLVRIADNLVKQGAEGILLGCTELPLVFSTKYQVSVFNSLEILSMALLNKYYQKS